MIDTISIAEQLVDIYYTHEHWHKTYMDRDIALKYHEDRIRSGNIVVCEVNGMVKGYYERYISNDKCYVHNVFILPEYRNSATIKWLYKHFFMTLPKSIKFIYGNKVKLLGKRVDYKLTRER